MFDTYRNDVHRHEHTTRSTITEHRAPTDESIRLLLEMETKALDKILKSIQICDNSFNCSMHIQENMLSGTKDVMIIYSLNGKRGEFKFSHRFELTSDFGTTLIPNLIKAFGEHLAISMLEQPFKESVKSIKF